jgi:D-3-phosphoglycerate dehydrogenase
MNRSTFEVGQESRQRVLITTAFLHAGDLVDLRLRAAGLDVIYCPELGSLPEEAQGELLSAVDGVIAGTSPLTAEIMDLAPRLKVVARTGVGFDNVDIASATERGIHVCITPGANRQSVAELVFTLMLAGARHLPSDLEEVQSGRWPQRTGRELNGSVLGIVGLGSIGKAVATIAAGFGMSILAFDPFLDVEYAAANEIKGVDLDSLLGQSDFVTLHVFLDDSTRHLMNRDAFAQMKPGAFLVNTSRGGIVDEEALVDAVENGHLAGAALDVFEIEPLPPSSRLRAEPNVIVSGHIAGATREARAKSGEMAADCVIEALGGRAVPHTVNGSALRSFEIQGAKK